MKYLLIFLVCIALAGCSSPINNLPDSGQADGNEHSPITPSPELTIPEDTAEIQENDPNLLTGWSAVSGDLSVRLSIQDMQVVDQSPWLVEGMTTPGAVVSINDTILVADEKGSFSTEIVLDEGANSLEVLVSDTRGNLVEAMLTLFYEIPT